MRKSEENGVGRVVLVTGATSGIGRATALAFARAGAAVVLAGRDRQRGEAVAEECRRLGAGATFIEADLAESGTAAALVAEVERLYGRLDVAFNNAGYREPNALLADQPDAAYEAVMSINARAVFEGMRAQIRLMLKQGGGVIVNNASVSAIRNASTGYALYCASKAAVISMTRSAALEYARRGIRINAVSPGRVATPMVHAKDIPALTAALPLGRMGTPEEVAEAVVWLASDSASFVVGHNLCVDGGYLAS